eukprot:7667732-Alexandrium_andersonii.AAC.1
MQEQLLEPLRGGYRPPGPPRLAPPARRGGGGLPPGGAARAGDATRWGSGGAVAPPGEAPGLSPAVRPSPFPLSLPPRCVVRAAVNGETTKGQRRFKQFSAALGSFKQF